MASYRTFARPYAKALFAIAKESKQLAAWNIVLSAFAFAMKNPHIKAWLKNVNVAQSEKIQWLVDLVKGTPDFSSIQKALNAFLTLLFKEQRLEVLCDVATLFHAFVLAEEGWVKVSVIAAKTLSPEMKAQIEKKLAQKFNAQMAVNYSEDTSLLGGIIIKADDWVMDASVQHQLVRLREKLC